MRMWVYLWCCVTAMSIVMACGHKKHDRSGPGSGWFGGTGDGFQRRRVGGDEPCQSVDGGPGPNDGPRRSDRTETVTGSRSVRAGARQRPAAAHSLYPAFRVGFGAAAAGIRPASCRKSSPPSNSAHRHAFLWWATRTHWETRPIIWICLKDARRRSSGDWWMGGLTAAFVDVSSHGEENPLVQTADNVANAKNRRVEVIVR